MRWSIGSTWHRWDPHIHAPGTLKENQYGSHDDDAVWARYFAKIREAQPTCSALGITDYFVPRGYRLFIERGGRTQLPGLLVFPNVELRLVTRPSRAMPSTSTCWSRRTIPITLARSRRSFPP